MTKTPKLATPGRRFPRIVSSSWLIVLRLTRFVAPDTLATFRILPLPRLVLLQDWFGLQQGLSLYVQSL